MTPAKKLAEIVAALTLAHGVAVGAGAAADPCVLVQVMRSGRNVAELAALGYGPAALALAGVPAAQGTVVHVVLCGDEQAASLTDAIVIGPAGTRSTGVGLVGQTAAEVQASGKWPGRIGSAFRCAPDPDNPGALNAACNSECACGASSNDAQRAQIDGLGVKYDCALWLAAGRDCKAGVP